MWDEQSQRSTCGIVASVNKTTTPTSEVSASQPTVFFWGVAGGARFVSNSIGNYVLTVEIEQATMMILLSELHGNEIWYGMVVGSQ